MSKVITLSAAESRRALDAALAKAEELGFTVAIAVVDHAGHLTSVARMDGSTFMATTMAANKAITSAGSGMSTHEMAGFLAADPVMLTAMAAQPGICILPGGAPIRIAGAVAGAIGVAGAPTSAEQQIALAGVAAAVGSSETEVD
ncbi:heme-binding protein [Microbispora sp. NPDC049125]|uniref:GlcG/HbpS family heme-binding protein n=1 Tax=Microbispora sp. NPDC049125 TaxID=3154929 RepID=UPI00346619D6